jgi:hypothetical protein
LGADFQAYGDNVRFCLRRQDKAPICKKYGITHFIDDRLEILSYLTDVPHKFLFQGSKGEIEQHAHALPLVTRLESWDDVIAKVFP